LKASKELIGQATEFVRRIDDLLNGTVTNGVRLSVVVNNKNGNCGIGYGLTTEVAAGPMPLTIGRAPTSYLTVDHRMKLDDQGIWLTDARSSFSVSKDAAGEQPLFRYDYVRNSKFHAEAHVHVESEFVHGEIVGVKPARKLHLPVGGRRFRPTLEDVIELLVWEGFAEGRAGWETVVARHREEWMDRQLMAAVRRNPKPALEALRAEGHLG
jgi:hypothetical protein